MVASVGTGLFAGCSGTDGDPNTMGTNKPLESDPEQTTETHRNTDTTTTASGPTAPEPRFVVDQNGDGDYESLQDAYRVAQNGDTIGINAGSYSVTLEGGDLDIKKSLTLVGAGRNETTVEIDGPGREISMSDNAINYWHITVEPARTNGYFYNRADWTVNYSEFNMPTRGWKGTAQIGSEINAYDSVFNASPIDKNAVHGVRQDLADTPLKIGVLNAVDSTFKTRTSVQETDISNSTFESRPRLLDKASSFSGGEIINSRFNNGIELYIGGGDGFEIKQSELYPDNEGNAFTISDARVNSSTSTSVTNSTIHGKIKALKFDSGWKGLARLKGNKFIADEIDGDYFIDGYGARNTFLNVFDGADIRIDSGNASVYHTEHELGNYYSMFDKEDEDDDGVIDLPRPIPGEGGLTDQYPLASDDLSNYGL